MGKATKKLICVFLVMAITITLNCFPAYGAYMPLREGA